MSRAGAVARGALAALVLAACAAAPPAPPPAAPPAPADFAVTLLHDERPVPGPDGRPFVAWRTTWELRWAPVPGATGYAVRYGTSEGAGDGAPDRLTPEPHLRVEAAAGTSPADQVAHDRDAHLALTAAQLSVSVAAVAPGGMGGAPSPWFAVGDLGPDGRPAVGEVGHGG